MATSRIVRLVLLLVPFAISAFLVLPSPIGALAAGEYNDATDFDVFYTGAQLAEQGRFGLLYDLELFPETLGRDEPNVWYAYSPNYARAWSPLTGLSIDTAFVVWTLASLTITAAIAAFSAARYRTAAALLGITVFPSAMNLQLGQNAAFSALLVGLAMLFLVRDRLVWAGICLGLMFKPQLAVGLGLWWLIDRRYRPAAWAALATVVATVSAGLLVDPAAWSSFFSALADLAEVRGQHLQVSLAGLVDLAFPEWEAARLVGTALGAAALLAALGWLARRPREPVLAFGVMVAVTLLATPYVLMYDWLILLAPVAALASRRDLSRLWIPAAVLSWTLLFSAVITDAMTDRFGFGIQVAPIALAIAVVLLVRIDPAPAVSS